MTEFFKVDMPKTAEVWGTMNGEWRRLTPEEVAEEHRQGLIAEAERLATKGHDCWDNVEHSTFATGRGGRQDAYNCGICGDLLQVG